MSVCHEHPVARGIVRMYILFDTLDKAFHQNCGAVFQRCLSKGIR